MGKRTLAAVSRTQSSSPFRGESTFKKFVPENTKQFFKVFTCLGLLIAFCLSLSGCKTGGLPLGLSGMKNQVVANSLSDMPNDAARVIASVGGLMTGSQSPHGVIIDQATSATILSGAVKESGFVMTDAKLFQYDSSSDPATRKIFAVAEFENPTGCKWTEEINAHYKVEKIGIKVLDISTRPVFETTPEVVCFVLPADKMPVGKGTLPPTFAALYQKIAEEAVLPTDPDISKEPEKWGMVVFFLDRISPTATARLSISADRDGTGGYAKDSRYVDYSGWRVGFVAGTFPLKANTPEQELYLKAIYTPGNEAGFIKNTTVVGLYSLAQ